MAKQAKLSQDEMKKMQDQMSRMKKELSKKVEDVISGKNEATKNNASDVGAGEHAHGKEMYSNMGFDYGQLIKGPPLHSLSINLGKPPHFVGTRYTDWSYKMKMHLIATRLWEVVGVGVMIPTNEDREITPEEVHNLYQNAQAIALLVSSLGLDEFKKVNGMESAKQIWDTLKVSFEGDKSVRKRNIKLLHGELERFMFLQNKNSTIHV